jgi:RimJ/RimL family protein N-acetyltransferase
MIGMLQRRFELNLGGHSATLPDLKVGRLRMISMTAAMLEADACGDGSLGRLLGARVTGEWPPEAWEPHVLVFIAKQMADQPQTIGWNRYVLRRDETGWNRTTLIGCVGGFPKPNGDVEIGYSTLPEFQRRGYATEAAKTLVNWLLTRDGVHSVSAQTFLHLPESIKVMERCGMLPVGEGDEPDTVRYRRMRT